MQIMMTGATGLVGTAVLRRLVAAGHRVICAGRSEPASLPAACSFLPVDFSHDTAQQWAPRLRDCDAVINTVGIFKSNAPGGFERLHVLGPLALFEGCVAAGVRRVVHLSALGADDGATTDYHRSKRRGDEALLGLPLDGVVAQPSLIFSGDGASSQAFLTLAALPLLPLPGGGLQPIQPLHVDDAAEALQALLEAPQQAHGGRRIALVGPRPIALRAYLESLRAQLGLGRARVLIVPSALVAIAARIGDRWSGALFDRAAWSMLQRGNTATPDDTTRLLGRLPRDVDAFIAPAHATALRLSAQVAWLLPALRLSLAIVWIVTGIVSAVGYPVASSYELLGRAGVPPALQPLSLYSAALLDLTFGILTLLPLVRRWRRPLWLSQAGLILGYTAVISVRMPEFWLHPYGPLLKNLPMLAILWMLWVLDARAPDRGGPRPASRP